MGEKIPNSAEIVDVQAGPRRQKLRSLKVVDLFAGCGGMSLGFQNAGFDTVNARIKNAKTQTTYLCADVNVVATYRCFNLNLLSLESQLHDFFQSKRLQITLTDQRGRGYQPREWFEIGLAQVNRAIELAIRGELGDYFFDDRSRAIVLR